MPLEILFCSTFSFLLHSERGATRIYSYLLGYRKIFSLKIVILGFILTCKNKKREMDQKQKKKMDGTKLCSILSFWGETQDRRWIVGKLILMNFPFTFQERQALKNRLFSCFLLILFLKFFISIKQVNTVSWHYKALSCNHNNPLTLHERTKLNQQGISEL